MANFYVNNNRQDSANFNNEVHREGCYWLSLAKEVTYLGNFDNCRDAVLAAKRIYPNTADGCANCCPACHKA